jgi:hypothetical protein
LAPYLDATQREGALAAARKIVDIGPRARALTALASHLEATERAEALVEALEAIKAIDEDEARSQVLGSLAEQLEGLRIADAASAARITANALTVARTISKGRPRSVALEALAPHLDAAQTTEALTAAREIDSNLDRLRVMSSLMPKLDAGQCNEILSEAPEAVRQITGVFDRVCALRHLLPLLDSTQQAELLSECLSAGRTSSDDSKLSRALALVLLAPCVDPSEQTDVLSDALRVARSVAPESDERARNLKGLVPFLDDHQRAEVLPEAFAFIRDLDRSLDPAQDLEELAPYLDAPQRAIAMEAALKLDAWRRAEALAALAPHFANDAPEDIVEIWKKSLRNLSANSRAAVCADLSALAPLIEVIGGPAGVRGLAQAVLDVGRWWP